MNQSRFARRSAPALAGARAAWGRSLAGAALLAGLALAGLPSPAALADFGGDLGDPRPLLTTPKISIDDVQATEPPDGSGVATFTVRLDHRRVDGLPVSVQFHTRPGTATPPADFVDTGGTLTFTPGGSLAQTIPVTIVDDGPDGTDAASFVEHYRVELSQTQNAVIAKRFGEGTILDADRPPARDDCDLDPTAPGCPPLRPLEAFRAADVTSGGEPTARPPIQR